MSFPEITIFVFAVLHLERGSQQGGVIFYGRISSLKQLPWWLSGKEPTCQCKRLAGDVGSIPESERLPGEGNGNPRQYSCLENPMDRVAWWATVHGVEEESDPTYQLNHNTGRS